VRTPLPPCYKHALSQVSTVYARIISTRVLTPDRLTHIISRGRGGARLRELIRLRTMEATEVPAPGDDLQAAAAKGGVPWNWWLVMMARSLGLAQKGTAAAEAEAEKIRVAEGRGEAKGRAVGGDTVGGVAQKGTVAAEAEAEKERTAGGAMVGRIGVDERVKAWRAGAAAEAEADKLKGADGAEAVRLTSQCGSSAPAEGTVASGGGEGSTAGAERRRDGTFRRDKETPSAPSRRSVDARTTAAGSQSARVPSTRASRTPAGISAPGTPAPDTPAPKTPASRTQAPGTRNSQPSRATGGRDTCTPAAASQSSSASGAHAPGTPALAPQSSKATDAGGGSAGVGSDGGGSGERDSGANSSGEGSSGGGSWNEAREAASAVVVEGVPRILDASSAFVERSMDLSNILAQR
jgi:hypothetical protein